MQKGSMLQKAKRLDILLRFVEIMQNKKCRIKVTELLSSMELFLVLFFGAVDLLRAWPDDPPSICHEPGERRRGEVGVFTQ